MIRLVKVNGRFYEPGITTGKTFSELDSIEEGYFLTKSKLEEFAKSVFDAGRAKRHILIQSQYGNAVRELEGGLTTCYEKEETFADYWQQKLKEIKK